MQVSVKILNGAEHNIQVSPDDSIQLVKGRIEKELNIPIVQQRLMFKGKSLADTSFLKDYNIQEGAKLHLSIKKDVDVNPSSTINATTSSTQQFTSSIISSSDEPMEYQTSTVDDKKMLFKYALEDTPLNLELRKFANENKKFPNIDEFVEIFNEEMLNLANGLTLDEIERYNEIKWRQEHQNDLENSN